MRSNFYGFILFSFTVNAALGAGLLNFGKAFDNAGGILVSSIIQLVFKHKI
jgi:hypothetical protein